MLPRVYIRPPVDDDWSLLLDLHQRSADYHFPWAEPAKDEQGCKRYIRRCQTESFEGMLIWHAADHQLVGVANLSQIFYGSFQNAYLGYYGSVDYGGQGLMTEGVGLVLNHGFNTLKLHRIEANIQPGNLASIKLVKRLGFTNEGFSHQYLKINGEWRDHERWALTVEHWQGW
ncbi:gcn5-related n-acetyltransferase [Leptolyngbya sp. Heron Island J]|uniref:GNAT family N-acetyltransferase n=1 Tax=Leptolyngbya sp. Heron Island J TaxID=1385935 RepID=UPI0003B9F6A3|nr:GNAT family N-acetyltransferase [Leptolyngbya sp. Heron Island J]ESA33851.1 gcn5-related n-acetyltransferase [Leptolyngbya sp. Heron Island J]